MFETFKKWLGSNMIHQEKRETKCLCCGNCCESFGWHLNASKSDLERWRKEGREDLLNRVNRLSWIWYNPHNGQAEERCPFLARSEGKTEVFCSIHETKPAMCRDYPTLAHGRRCLRGTFV